MPGPAPRGTRGRRVRRRTVRAAHWRRCIRVFPHTARPWRDAPAPAVAPKHVAARRPRAWRVQRTRRRRQRATSRACRPHHGRLGAQRQPEDDALRPLPPAAARFTRRAPVMRLDKNRKEPSLPMAGTKCSVPRIELRRNAVGAKALSRRWMCDSAAGGPGPPPPMRGVFSRAPIMVGGQGARELGRAAPPPRTHAPRQASPACQRRARTQMFGLLASFVHAHRQS